MRHLAILPFLFFLSACSTIGYYSQSVSGQFQLFSSREDIHKVIESPDTSTELKHKLQEAVKIRQFASEHLKLPDNKSYLYYADLERPYVVWNVFAAPEFSLQPKTWCYLVVGCVSYRGYFDKSDAIENANALKKDNYDVHIAGIAAYSTLGWFDDPLMNTMMHWRTRSLASLIYHELSHQVIFISNETAFNEAFSTAVERLGTIHWLLATHPDELSAYLDFLKAQQQFRALLLNTRTELEQIYASELTDFEKRVAKYTAFEKLKQDYEEAKTNWPESIHFDNWFKSPLNNARLTATMTYLQQVPAFYQIFKENKADWESFFAEILNFEDMDKTERDSLINTKLQNTPTIAELVELIETQHF